MTESQSPSTTTTITSKEDHHHSDDSDSDSSSSSSSNNTPSSSNNTSSSSSNNNNNNNKLSTYSQRLFNLQLRMNQAKQDNIEQVKEEEELKQYEKKPFYKHKNVIENEMTNLNVSLNESVEFEKKRKRSQKHVLEGWECLNSNALYKQHKKRIKQNINTNINTTINNGSDDNNDLNLLTYGSNSNSNNITEENKQAMVNELTSKKKNKKKKKDQDDESDETVLYISNSNKHFTKSLSKAYDKYTDDIRSNLERGTAL